MGSWKSAKVEGRKVGRGKFGNVIRWEGGKEVERWKGGKVERWLRWKGWKGGKVGRRDGGKVEKCECGNMVRWV